jgi:hypothetical protein
MKSGRLRIVVEVKDERECLFRLSSPLLEPLQDPEIEPKHWFLKRLEVAYESAMRTIERAESGLLLWLKKLIHYLESKIGPEEALMRQLRTADLVEIVYPSGYQEKWVRRHFRRFIRRQVHHHQRWLVINFLLLPLTGAMMLLPGPNVFFGWNAFRLISHYLAREGGQRVRRGRCEIRFNPQSAIRNPQLI